MDKYDLKNITYQPRYRDGYGSTGGTGAPQGMVYWVGEVYGPHETLAEAEEASAKLIARKQEEENAEIETKKLASEAAKKLTQEEYDAIFDCGFAEGRGYW